MNIKRFKYLFLILLVSCSLSNSQKIVTDTLSGSLYSCYYEHCEIYKYVFPDSTSLKAIENYDFMEDLNNNFITKFYTAIYKNTLYSFEDFELCFGTDCFSYSFIETRKRLSTNILSKNINDIHLKNKKTGEKLKIDRIEFYKKESDLEYKPISSLPSKENNNSELLELYNKGIISIKISDYIFPYRSPLEMYKQNEVSFPIQNFVVY